MATILGVGKGDSLNFLKAINFLVLVVALFSLICSYHVVVEAEARSLSEDEDLELESQLKILNKPSIKTIHTEWGDTIDCVDIHKQPAFDHPLLKNHKIQMKPSFIPKRSEDETSSAAKRKRLGLKALDEECPQGTVPIRRTLKEDLIRAKFSSSMAFPGASKNDPIPNGQYVAGLKYQITEEAYYGISAAIDVQNPDSVRPDQFTAAEIMVANGPRDQMNAIATGWMVHPGVYGNNVTRFFTYWTTNGADKGCHNTLCPGFVQVSQTLRPDSPPNGMSVYEGPQFVTDVQVYLDRAKNNWWLVYGQEPIGYWPNSLFPLFLAGGSYVYWGGHVKASVDAVTPRMGSGHLPDGNYRHASFFNRIQYMDESNNWVDPNGFKVEEMVNCPPWLRLKYYGSQGEKRHTFQYGGPGGRCP